MSYAKYGNKRTEVDGIAFASRAEARRYGVLKILQMAGEISGLTLQPRFPLVVNGVKVCTYVGDFQYQKGGFTVVEDVKGTLTPVYKIKRSLLKACHNIDVMEVS